MTETSNKYSKYLNSEVRPHSPIKSQTSQEGEIAFDIGKME